MKINFANAAHDIKEFASTYARPSHYRVAHRLSSIDNLSYYSEYDLFILDGNCLPMHEQKSSLSSRLVSSLREIGRKSDILTDSSYDDMLRLRDLYGDMMSISKLVSCKDAFMDSNDLLLHFESGKLQVFNYFEKDHVLIDRTSIYSNVDKLLFDMSKDYSKTSPKLISSVIDASIYSGKILQKKHRILMVGDSYLPDIVAGNLAGIENAKARPYVPLNDTPARIAIRLLDLVYGGIMSRFYDAASGCKRIFSKNQAP